MTRLTVFVFLLACSVSVHAANSCVVLQYHHISDDTPPITSVTLDQFDAHLEYLKNNRFHVMPLREVVHAIHNGKTLPEKCVSLSVDDDGRRFDGQTRLSTSGWPMGIGLLGMKERLESLGGRLEIESRPGQGTRLVAHVPAGGAP